MGKAFAVGGIFIVIILLCNAGCGLLGAVFGMSSAAAADYTQYDQKIVAIAKELLAQKPMPGWHNKDDQNQKYPIPYVWGGGHSSNPGPSTGVCEDNSSSCYDTQTVGLDCSGFVRWVYYIAFDNHDVLDGGTEDQMRLLQKVNAQDAQPGDLAFFDWDGDGKSDHVGIYIGNNQMIEESQHGEVVKTGAVNISGLMGFYHYTPPTSLLQELGGGNTNTGTDPNNITDPGANCSGDCAKQLITQVFGKDAADAITVATCESSLNPRAVNPTSQPGGPPEGLFQIVYPGTWNGTKEANQSPFDAKANTLAAYDIFKRDGDWREWQCAQEHHINPYN